MFRLFAVAALAGLAAAAPAPTDPAYRLTLKPEAKGDRVQVTASEESAMRVVLTVGGNKLDKPEKKVVKEAYTEEIVDKPAGSKKPARLTRAYTVATVAKDKEKTEFPYQGKTVVIAKKGDKYEFTVDGKDLAEADAVQLDEEFNKPSDIPLEDQDFLPDKAVKVNDSWTVDPDKVAKGFEGGDGPFVVHKDKTTVTGKLVKVYEKDGRRFGVIELSLKLAVKQLKLEGEEIPVKDGGTVTGAVTLDRCIDGTSHTGTEKGEFTFDLVGEVPNGTIQLSGKVKMTKTVEDLAAK